MLTIEVPLIFDGPDCHPLCVHEVFSQGAIMSMRLVRGSFSMSALPRKQTSSAGYTSMRSINVGSSAAAFELFTLRDTGYICSDL